jgi:hypothetical protein
VTAATSGPDGGAHVRRSIILLVGAALNGAFASLAMWMAGRALGLEPFEALAQLWTIWGLTATGLAFAFQQWEVARNVGIGPGYRRQVPNEVKVALIAIAVVVLAITVVLRVRIFGSGSWVWPLAAATLPIGTAITGMGYATVARTGRLSRLAAVMALENGVRLLLTGILVLAGAPALLFALTIPIGFLVSLIPVLTTAVVQGADDDRRAVSAAQLPELAFIGFAKTFLVFGGPLLLGAAGGEAAVVSTLFLVLIIPRVPFLLVNALVPTVIVHANEAVVGGRPDRVRRWVMLLAALGACSSLLGGGFGYLTLDPVAEVLFAAGGQLNRLVYGLLGAAVGFALVTSLTNPLLIALSRTRLVTVSWALVVLSGVLLTLAGTIADPVSLTAWMLVCAAAVLLIHLGAAITVNSSPRP